jgi:hypothetical protein
VRSLSRGLAYRGEASGKRQTYYVFQGDDFFVIFSFSKTKPNSGNFNIVSPRAVEYVRSRFRRSKGVTAKDVVAKAKRSGHVPNSLAALNVLYVLAAQGHAKVDARRAGPRLYFNLTGRRA